MPGRSLRYFLRNIVDDLVRFFFHIHHLMGSCQIDPARKGGDHAGLPPLKKPGAKLFFQAEKLLVQGGLGEEQLLGCF